MPEEIKAIRHKRSFSAHPFGTLTAWCALIPRNCGGFLKRNRRHSESTASVVRGLCSVESCSESGAWGPAFLVQSRGHEHNQCESQGITDSDSKGRLWGNHQPDSRYPQRNRDPAQPDSPKPARAFQPPTFPQTRIWLVSSPCSHLAHPRFYSAHCSHPATAPGAAQACPLCLPSGSNQRTGSGDFRLGCPVEKAFRFAFRTFQLGGIISGTGRSILILRHALHVPDRRSTDPRTCEIHPPICHFAAGVSGFPVYALRFGQIDAPVMTTGVRVVHLNGLLASRPIQINVFTPAPADSRRLLDVLSLMSAPCSGRQGLRPLAPPLLTGPAHQLTCPGYARSCRPIERAVRFASVPSQFGDFINLHSAFPPARVRNLAPVALICGHCSGRRARRFLGPSAFADAASQRSFPKLSGSIRPFSPSSLSPKPQLRTQRKGVGIPFDLSIGVFGNPLQDSSIHRPRPVDPCTFAVVLPGPNDRQDSTFPRKSAGGSLTLIFPPLLRVSGTLRRHQQFFQNR